MTVLSFFVVDMTCTSMHDAEHEGMYGRDGRGGARPVEVCALMPFFFFTLLSTIRFTRTHIQETCTFFFMARLAQS